MFIVGNNDSETHIIQVKISGLENKDPDSEEFKLEFIDILYRIPTARELKQEFLNILHAIFKVPSLVQKNFMHEVMSPVRNLPNPPSNP